MKSSKIEDRHSDQRGVALLTALLMLTLLLALAMGITFTAISEMGVSRTYQAQTIAFQAAEAGLNHAVSLVANYRGAEGDARRLFNQLLADRAHPGNDYLSGNNPFVTANRSKYATGVLMIDEEIPGRGYALRDGVLGVPVEDVFYRVSVIDDEPINSSSPLKVPNFNPGAGYAEIVSPDASDANTDKNNRLVIYSTGSYLNALVTLEGWVGFLPYPALSSNQNIEISGNTEIGGSYGSVHSNASLIAGTGGGNSWHIEQSATSTGHLVGNFTSHVNGFYGGGQSELELPTFVTTEPLTVGGSATSPRMQDFLIRRADVILLDPSFANGANGFFPNGDSSDATERLTDLAERLDVPYDLFAGALDSDADRGNNVQQDGPVAVTIMRDENGVGLPTRVADISTIGWTYNNASSPWNIANNLAHGHTVYVVGADNYKGGPLDATDPSTPNGGNVKLTGNIGQGSPAIRVTILATGSINIEGNPNMAANLTSLQTPMLPPFVKIDVLMVAVEDIKVRGDFNAAISFTGITFAGEQVNLSGNGSINGQIIAFSNQNVRNSLVEGPNGDPNRSTVTGSFELTLNEGNSVGRVRLYSWRQIKR